MRIVESNQQTFRQLQGMKHFNHAVKGNKFWRRRLRSDLQEYFGFDVWRLPVCKGCEGWALWHKDTEGNPVGACMHCGHITKDPITVQEYYEQDHHIDRTIQKDAPYVVDRQVVAPKQVHTVYGGEAGLPDENKKLIIARR